MTHLFRSASLVLLALPAFGSLATSTTCTATATGGTVTQTDPVSCFAGANIPQSPTSIVATASAGIANETSVGDGYTSSFNYNVNVRIATFGTADASVTGTNTRSSRREELCVRAFAPSPKIPPDRTLSWRHPYVECGLIQPNLCGIYILISFSL